jgi:ATP-binding cassette subfamily C protein PrsD
VPPGGDRLVVNGVSFTLTSGTALGIIGPSASGKSSLARALVGVWRPARGTIRLDGATLDQWSPEARGRHIGYLPQDMELFEGTIGQNIARFEANPDPEAIIKAAEQAGVHDLVVRPPARAGSVCVSYSRHSLAAREGNAGLADAGSIAVLQRVNKARA